LSPGIRLDRCGQYHLCHLLRLLEAALRIQRLGQQVGDVGDKSLLPHGTQGVVSLPQALLRRGRISDGKFHDTGRDRAFRQRQRGAESGEYGPGSR